MADDGKANPLANMGHTGGVCEEMRRRSRLLSRAEKFRRAYMPHFGAPDDPDWPCIYPAEALADVLAVWRGQDVAFRQGFSGKDTAFLAEALEMMERLRMRGYDIVKREE